jgi:hypothetical protein
VAIIDKDNDKLDDRLVGPDEPNATDMEFSALLDRVEKVRLIQLPSEILGHMHEDIVKEQDELKSKLAKLEIQLHRNLVKGNASF